jgi:hypothetical protein
VDAGSWWHFVSGKTRVGNLSAENAAGTKVKKTLVKIGKKLIFVVA